MLLDGTFLFSSSVKLSRIDIISTSGTCCSLRFATNGIKALDSQTFSFSAIMLHWMFL